jgi:hypothetical protein
MTLSPTHHSSLRHLYYKESSSWQERWGSSLRTNTGNSKYMEKGSHLPLGALPGLAEKSTQKSSWVPQWASIFLRSGSGPSGIFPALSPLSPHPGCFESLQTTPFADLHPSRFPLKCQVAPVTYSLHHHPSLEEAQGGYCCMLGPLLCSLFFPHPSPDKQYIHITETRCRWSIKTPGHRSLLPSPAKRCQT